MGCDVIKISPYEPGEINARDIFAAVNEDTFLVSCMLVNNENGYILPVEKAFSMIKKKYPQVITHCDCVQGCMKIPVKAKKLNADMISLSGHKIHAQKGCGVLYVNKKYRLPPFIDGGAQERGRRAGTENVPGIVGYGAAAERAMKNMKERTEKEIELRDYLINRLTTEIPYSRLNGDRVKRLPNNVNVSFQFIEGESMLLMLDQNGICGSSGSACTSGSLDPSHVLLAIGLPHEIAHGSLRLTLSEETTKEELDFTVDKLKEIVQYLRSMSPLYEDFMKHQK